MLFLLPKALRSPLQKGQRRAERAMTLIEIIIVVAILATFTAILVSNLSQRADQAKEDQARIGMANVAQALQLYRVHNNQFPSTQQGLLSLVKNPGIARWRGPYIEKKQLRDPWGEPYEYSLQEDGSFQMRSKGVDGISGSSKDIYYPEPEPEEDEAIFESSP